MKGLMFLLATLLAFAAFAPSADAETCTMSYKFGSPQNTFYIFSCAGSCGTGICNPATAGYGDILVCACGSTQTTACSGWAQDSEDPEELPSMNCFGQCGDCSGYGSNAYNPPGAWNGSPAQVCSCQ
jgi:hypothetical protein